MKHESHMQRKTCKRTLGLLYLICLTSCYLWTGILISHGGVWGKDMLFIPVIGFPLAAAVTFLVWIFLKATVRIEPPGGEERGIPFLKRLDYLQLFAITGTLTAVQTYAIFRPGDFPGNDTFYPAAQVMALCAIHAVVAALSALLLYAGPRTRHPFLALLCFPAFIAVHAGDYIATSILVNDDVRQENVRSTLPPSLEELMNPPDYGETEVSLSACPIPPPRDNEEEPACGEEEEGVEEEEYEEDDEYEEEDDFPWMKEAGGSVVRYFNEIGWNEEADSTIFAASNTPFVKSFLGDFAYLRWFDMRDDTLNGVSRNSFTTGDFHNVQLLVSHILDVLWEGWDGWEDKEELFYQALSGRVVPEVLKILDYGNLYRSSGLEQLVDMLDYAYHDLQLPHDHKAAMLYTDLELKVIDREHTDNLYPYFSRPHALFHQWQDEHVRFWSYTFWARRWAQHNTLLCRRLLDDILKVHPNTLYTVDGMEKLEQEYHHKRLQKFRQSRDSVLAEIRNAFAGRPRPEKDGIIRPSEHRNPEQAETGDRYARYAWTEVPPELLREKRDILHAFTPEAFAYYLPAFLSSVVGDYRPGEEMNGTLVWTLTCNWNNLDILPMQHQRFRALSREEGAAVCHALEWLMAEHGEDFVNPSDGSSDLRQAIDSWWWIPCE